jgi:hypothetical protein
MTLSQHKPPPTTPTPDDFLYSQPGLAATAEALTEVNCASFDKDSLLGRLAWGWLDQTLMIARAAVVWRAAEQGLIDGDPRTLAFAHLHDRCGEDPEAEQQVEALAELLLSTEEVATST